MHIEILVHSNYKEGTLTITKPAKLKYRPRKSLEIQWPSCRTIMLAIGANYLYERALKSLETLKYCFRYVISVVSGSNHLQRVRLLF